MHLLIEANNSVGSWWKPSLLRSVALLQLLVTLWIHKRTIRHAYWVWDRVCAKNRVFRELPLGQTHKWFYAIFIQPTIFFIVITIIWSIILETLIYRGQIGTYATGSSWFYFLHYDLTNLIRLLSLMIGFALYRLLKFKNCSLNSIVFSLVIIPYSIPLRFTGILFIRSSNTPYYVERTFVDIELHAIHPIFCFNWLLAIESSRYIFL